MPIIKSLIVRKWRNRYWAKYAPETLQKVNLLRADAPAVTVWLGGPGREHVMHTQRRLIKKLLEKEGFKVVFGEDKGRFDITRRELLEFETSVIAIILSISAGAAGEALDFANIEDLQVKLYVYCPTEYKRGYVFRSLRQRHKILPNERMFSLSGFRRYHEELPHKILHAAITESIRLAMNRRRQTQVLSYEE